MSVTSRFLSTHPRLVLGIAIVLASVASSELIMAQDAPAATPDDVGYFLGMSVGQQLAQQGFQAADFTAAGLTKGLTDALAGKDATLTDQQMQAVAEKIESTLRTRQQAEMEERKKQGVANLEKSNLFLQENAKKEGVKQLASGLQYKVITSGNGKSPTAENTVKVHYTGKLINGRTFDSSVERGEPATFGVGQVIPGWRQALQEMKVGDKWMLYIPPQLAYGAQGTPGRGADEGIGPNEVLIFEVELLDIVQ
ncbi:MAG: FKBP-type peptidyl-prolyl cis-trans isomerase [Planctomycetaceae bacterium]